MADLRINLLPWRQGLREQKRRTFLQALLGAFLLGVALVATGYQLSQRSLDSQQAINGLLQADISLMNERIDQIGQLQKQRQALQARMQIVQQLQDDRMAIVHVFHELTVQLAPGVWFTNLARNGDELRILGVAESSKQISTQLRNLVQSRWFTKPNVLEITARPEVGPHASQFEIAVFMARGLGNGEAAEAVAKAESAGEI